MIPASVIKSRSRAATGLGLSLGGGAGRSLQEAAKPPAGPSARAHGRLGGGGRGAESGAALLCALTPLPDGPGSPFSRSYFTTEREILSLEERIVTGKVEGTGNPEAL